MKLKHVEVGKGLSLVIRRLIVRHPLSYLIGPFGLSIRHLLLASASPAPNS